MPKYSGLKKKWHKALKAELDFLELPEPEHKYGFTNEQLIEHLSATEFKNFWRWMYGQTMMMGDNGSAIVYTEDVIRGLRLVRYGTPTYFD